MRRRMAAASFPLKTALFCVLMIVLASASNAVMDVLFTRYDRSLFVHFPEQQRWLDPRISWVNKWKDGDPKKGEAFPLSSTVFVSTTDAWHCFKALTILFLSLAIIAPWTHLVRLRWWGWIAVLVGVHLVYGVVFEGLYANGLVR